MPQKISASGTVNYLYDSNDVIEELDSAGGVLAKYAQGQGVDQPLAILRGGSLGYYEADGLGSITSLTDNAAEIANSYTYDAFGKLNASSGTVVNPFRYTAREFDTEYTLYYYRARYYDARGRFLSEDPVGFGAGINRYIYVLNNPTNLRDPSGLWPRPRDKWWGYSDRDFQKWFHRCWKRPGDPDAGKEEIEEAYAEWLNRGSPKGGECWSTKKKCEADEKEWWKEFRRSFFEGANNDLDDIEWHLKHPPVPPQNPVFPPLPPWWPWAWE